MYVIYYQFVNYTYFKYLNGIYNDCIFLFDVKKM